MLKKYTIMLKFSPKMLFSDSHAGPNNSHNAQVFHLKCYSLILMQVPIILKKYTHNAQVFHLKCYSLILMQVPIILIMLKFFT